MKPEDRLEGILRFVAQAPEDIHLVVEESLGSVDLIVYCRACDVPLFVGPKGSTINALSIVASCLWQPMGKRARFPGEAIRGINPELRNSRRAWDQQEYERECVALANDAFGARHRSVNRYWWVESKETGIQKLMIELDANDENQKWEATIGGAVQTICAAAAKARGKRDVAAWVVGASCLSGDPDRG